MKFKENAIKPGMVIHCPKEEDARALSEYLIKLGTVNANHIMEYYGLDNGAGKVDTVLITRREENLYAEYSDRKWFEKDEYHMKITEFSDLIEPEANKANNLANSLDNQDNDLDNQRDNEMSAVEVAEENSIETVKPITNKACLELWQQEGEEETVHYLFHGSEELLQAYLAENSTDGEKSTEMSAVEVLEWFTGADCNVLAEIFDYQRDVGSILGQFTVSEIIDRITTYEASKKEKPVEVEEGYDCRLYDKNLKIILNYCLWGADEEYAKADAINKAIKQTKVTGERVYTAVNYTCQIKEGK